jgi:hypothetical protein
MMKGVKMKLDEDSGDEGGGEADVGEMGNDHKMMWNRMAVIWSRPFKLKKRHYRVNHKQNRARRNRILLFIVILALTS